MRTGLLEEKRQFRVWVGIGILLGTIAGVVATYSPASEANRSPSGTYSLPAGNPVVSGTTITSTWANTTMADIGAELTDSLNRSGKGGMLAPLRLPNGSSSAPALAWTSETNTGLYWAAAADIRMQVGSTQIQRWNSTGVTFPLAATITGASTLVGELTTQGGISASTTTVDANAITATGNGDGAGVSGIGGSSGGVGGHFAGGGSGGTGSGVEGFGAGTADGVVGSGGSSGGRGVVGLGGGTAVGGRFSNGTSATGGTRQDALSVTNGDISLDGVATPLSTTAVKNRLTPSNLVKAWGIVTAGAATPTINTGFNLSATISCSTNAVNLKLAQPMSGSTYAILVTSDSQFIRDNYSARSLDADDFEIRATDTAGGVTVDLCSTASKFSFMVLGVQ